MVAKDMKTTLLLTALFNDTKLTWKSHLAKIIKQRHPLLYLLFTLSVFSSSTAFTKQDSPFVKTANIYSIVQDKKDFIWISGQNGLYRFDGKQVINFSNKDNGWSIPFNWIQGLSKHDDQLILSTETKGLWLFDTDTGKTQPININAETNTFYRAIHHKNSYYAISMAPQHLYRYDIISGKTTVIAKDIGNNQLFASESRVYFNDNEKLYYLDTNHSNNNIFQVTTVNEKIMTATTVKDTAIMASKNHLYSIDDQNKIIKIRTPSPITVVSSDNEKNAIFSVDLLGRITKRTIKTLELLNSHFDPVEASKYQVLLHDTSGVLWLGNNRGIQQLTESKIKNHLAIFDTKFSSIETAVYQQDLYIGSYGDGIHILYPTVKSKINSVENINLTISAKAKKTMDLLAIDQDLYIASFDGLWRYNKKVDYTQQVNLSFDDNDFSHSILLKLTHNNNVLYIATDGQGLLIYDLNKGVVTQHISKSAGLSSDEIIDVLPLASGDIWLATANGIDVLNSQTKTIKNITKQTTAKYVSLIQADDKIFAATKGNGIYVYNQQGQLLTHFAKGINFGYMSLIDDRILISAKPALYTINPSNYLFSIVTSTGDYSFTDNAFIFDNSLYIANSTGLLQLPRTTTPTFHPKVYISKTTVSGKSYLLNKTINIDSGNDVVTLDLASLDYRPGVDKKFRYTLDGNKWHQIHGHQLTLTGLTSGDYHIEITATNSLGQWSNYKAYTEINVAFPWYWTPQIRFIYSVVLFCIIFFSAWLLYLRSKSISHIHGILQKDINNYGKTSMQVKRNLNAALALISDNEINKGKSLLQQCIDDLNKQHKLSEPNSLNGNPLNEAVPFLAEYLANKYQVNLSFQFDLNENELDYVLKADLYRVIYEAITSAILNGSGRNFKVILQKFKNKIWLNIRDDSQSFIHFNSKVNFDISMYYIRQIANKHRGSINTFNEQGNSSQLVLSLPILHEN